MSDTFVSPSPHLQSHNHNPIQQTPQTNPQKTQPIPTPRLTQITSSACATALATATSYQHEATAAWNNAIINTILQALIAETSPAPNSLESLQEEGAGEGRYKFAVNSTIIQHLSDPRHHDGTAAEGEEKVEEGAEVKGKVGRRGMHSASGAYWNNERDGMWSYKYEGGESKGMDIVVSVMWIGV